MSQRWDDHMAALNALIAQHPRTPYVPPAPVAPAPIDWAALLGAGNGEMWQGGENGGQVGGVGGFDAGGAPGDMSNLFGGINPGTIGGWGGGLVGGLLGGPFGALAGSVGGRALMGLLGGNETNTGAGMLGNDAKDSLGMMNSGFGDMGGAGGMDTGGSNSNAGKEGDVGAMNGFQGGGYTGAGVDGVVQPWRRAGVVHEGEMVIPAHLVRRMGLLAR